MTNESPSNRAAASALGAYIGDALAMPAHWFYDPAELRRTFGLIDRYVSPPRHHPGSILWRSRYEPTEPEYDILGEQRQYWGRRGVHYHQFLEAGENTLNLKLLRLVLLMVKELGGYDRDEFIRRYRRFMLEPAGHRDTYVEECHRGFFENLRRGVPAGRCAVEEKHIGGMVAVVPLYALLRSLGTSDAEAADATLSHVSVTHAGRKVADAARTLLVLARELVDGDPRRTATDTPSVEAEETEGPGRLAVALDRHLSRQDLPYLQGPIARHAARPPEDILGRVYSTACYLEESMPAVFYLALRYADSPRDGLIANTMAGGDNCHRGAVLGSLYGLDGGPSVFPEPWRADLAAGE